MGQERARKVLAVAVYNHFTPSVTDVPTLLFILGVIPIRALPPSSVSLTFFLITFPSLFTVTFTLGRMHTPAASATRMCPLGRLLMAAKAVDGSGIHRKVEKSHRA